MATFDDDEEEEKEEEDETEEEFFSDHTRSMRLAWCSCEKRMMRLLPHIIVQQQQQQQDGKNSISISSNQEKQKTQYYWTSIFHELDEIRYQSYNELWDSNKTAATTTTVTDFPEIHIQEYISNSNAQGFRDTYHNRNIPCLINGLDKTSFEYLDKEWRQHQQQRQQNSTSSRYYDWFLQHVGPKTLVPLRYNSIIDNNNNNNSTTATTTSSPSSSILDEEGRAIECQTRHVTMEEWLQIIKEEKDDDDDGDDNNKNNKSNNTVYYLKDWHLQLLLEQQQNKQKQKQLGDDPFINHQNNNNKLYDVPDIFQYDLLNNFLLQFTKGDYRFCYFGPRNSTTQQHSDVMHSFSWSYNVVGTKQWTFYYKSKNMNEDKNDDDNNYIRFIQRAGQAVFVPSQWQHSVVNLEETISINHNWITTANIDLIWDCIKTETIAIHKELVSWQLHENWESCESMLLGCVGLDITAFLLMIWIRLLDILLLLEFDDTYDTVVPSFDDDNGDNNKVDVEKNSWGETRQQRSSSSSSWWWDICRLSATLYVVINDDSIHVRERLDAVLKDKGMATKLLDDIHVVLDFVVQRKTYNAM